MVIENRVWEPAAELMPRAELSKLQLARLKSTIARASRIEYYRREFEARKISADSFNSLDDLRRLPFTTKQEMRDAYPFGFFALPPSQLARIHGSSGTTGKPTMVGYSQSDMELWAGLCARFLTAGGLTSDQLVQVAFGYGLFTGGFGLHYGIERVGAATVPASSGNTQRQITLLHDLGIDTLICTPSYALNIAEVLKASGLKPEAMKLKYGHFGAEPWTEQMRERVEEELHIRAFNNYGLSEIIGPGVAGECAARRGMHFQEDHFIVECIDPDTLEPVAEGEYGELVITTLTKEACPMIRYRTRDLAKLYSDPCPCGRTGKRMSWVKGRSDDMMIIRGVNIFPSQLEEALFRVGGTAAHYQIELYRPHNLDEAVLKVEMQPEQFSDRMDELQGLKERIVREVCLNTGVQFRVELVAPNSLERFVGKAKRVHDHRDLKVD